MKLFVMLSIYKRMDVGSVYICFLRLTSLVECRMEEDQELRSLLHFIGLGGPKVTEISPND